MATKNKQKKNTQSDSFLSQRAPLSVVSPGSAIEWSLCCGKSSASRLSKGENKKLLWLLLKGISLLASGSFKTSDWCAKHHLHT